MTDTPNTEELIARLRAEQVPAGYVLVPVEPTPEMIGAMAIEEASGSINGQPAVGMAGAALAYEAMLAAAPPPPAQPAPPSADARDAVRLDWLMRHVPGRALRPLIGVMAWSGDIDEFRAAIDAAAGKEST
jgi:hypothetical protein